LGGSGLLPMVLGFAPALVEILFTMAEFKAARGSFGVGATFGGGGGGFDDMEAGFGGVEETTLGW